MHATRKISLLSVRSILAAVVAVGFVLPPSPTRAQSFVRIEIHPVSTVTLTGDQFLTGDKNGKPVVLAGELRIPKPGAEKLAAVVLVHGSGGLDVRADSWARELNGIGVATFVLDSFTGRGIVNTNNDQSQLNSLAMMVDAYRALALLAEHPRIDPDRIAIMGFSKGAVAAVYSSNERFRQMYAPGTLKFAAHIGLYTPCNVTYREDTKTTGKPIRLFHGIADDYVSIAPCRAYVERLKAAGANATLTEFPGTYHAYDKFTFAQAVKLPEAQTTRNCLLEERQNGQIFNSKSGKPYDLSDPCVEKGPQVAYNADAHRATVQDVKDFLKGTFDLK